MILTCLGYIACIFAGMFIGYEFGNAEVCEYKDPIKVKIDEKNVAGIKFKEGIKLKNFNTGMATEMMKELVGLNDVVYFETEKSKPNKEMTVKEKQAEPTQK